MNTRFVHHVQVERPAATEDAAGARERLRAKFPRPALRRMTHVGMLVGSALEGVTITGDDALVYASTFAETRALEDYLRTFPTPSPLLFQTSIQPSAVQQVLIARQQPIARLWPVTGRSRLVEEALTVVLLETAARVILVGGEERGTWMLEHGMASERAFAFALVLTREPAGAIGRIESAPLERSSPDGEAAPLLEVFADTLAARRPLQWRGAGSEWTLDWS